MTVMAERRPGRLRSITRRRPGRTPWLDWMIVPTLVILAGVVGYPIVRTVILSFQRYKPDTGLPVQNVGVQNYKELWADPVFWQSLRVTLIYTFGSVAIAVVLGLTLALLTENFTGVWRYLRSILLTPWAVPLIVVAFLFRYIFDTDAGVANAILRDFGILGANGKVQWLTSDTWALPTVMLANIWTLVPFFYLIFTASLTSVPTAVVESARVDRAGLWAMIFRIKLPYLRGAAVVASLIAIINNFNDFAKIYSMTGGGPGYSTTALVVYVYQLAFTSYNFGYASAIGVVWLVLLILFAILYIRLARPQRRTP